MGTDRSRWGELADINLARFWSVLGARSGASVREQDGSAFVATGLPIAFFNGVFAAGPATDPEGTIAAAVGFMARHEVPWLLWVRDGVDDELLAVGRRAGLRDAGGPPGMLLPSIPTSPPAPDELSIEIVTDRVALEVARDLMARGFEMPSEVGGRLIADAVLDDPTMRFVVGSVAATPVACATVAISGSTAGIYNVATPAEHRRRGYGTALTWAAIQEGRRQGCDHAALQASDLGAPIYRSMGFIDVGRYIQLEGPPSE